jgi:hypothetical protein
MRAHFSTFEKRPTRMTTSGMELIGVAAECDAGHGPNTKRVIHRVIAREPMRIGQKRYQVDRMNGWYEIEFREVGTKRRRTFNLDELGAIGSAKKASCGGSAQTQKRQKASRVRLSRTVDRLLEDDVKNFAPKGSMLPTR